MCAIPPWPNWKSASTPPAIPRRPPPAPTTRPGAPQCGAWGRTPIQPAHTPQRTPNPSTVSARIPLKAVSGPVAVCAADPQRATHSSRTLHRANVLHASKSSSLCRTPGREDNDHQAKGNGAGQDGRPSQDGQGNGARSNNRRFRHGGSHGCGLAGMRPGWDAHLHLITNPPGRWVCKAGILDTGFKDTGIGFGLQATGTCEGLA